VDFRDTLGVMSVRNERIQTRLFDDGLAFLFCACDDLLGLCFSLQ
jgi:hypothetical protein